MHSSPRLTRSITYWIVIGVLVLSYARGMFIPLMHNDAGHHAIMAMRMHLTGDYVNIMDRGTDYLDKPHFHFWSSAFFFNLLGVNPFSYRLTSILFSVVTLLSVYGIGKELYGKKEGRLAVLMVVSSIAFILANQDVRMDAILTGSIMAATWQLLLWVKHQRIFNMILGCLSLAIGFSTKGALGVVMPLAAIFLYLIYARDWKSLFNINWLVAAFVTVIFIAPVLYCYYLQYDLHPEKIIRGQTDISGIKFILFGQSLERFEGKNFGAAGSNDPFVFVNTYLWAFLPWTIPGLMAYFKSGFWFVKNKFRFEPNRECMTFGTITLFFTLFSLSSFKLPHYILVLIPFYALQTAAYICSLPKKSIRDIKAIQAVVVFIMFIVLVAINFYAFPITEIWLWIFVSVAVLGLGYSIYLKPKTQDFALKISLSAAAVTALALNFNFYPKLLTYQSGKILAERVEQSGIDKSNIRVLEDCEISNDFDFELQANLLYISIEQLKQSRNPLYIYTGPKGMDLLNENAVPFSVVDQQDNFRVTRLTPQFLRQSTRQETLKPFYVLHYSPAK